MSNERIQEIWSRLNPRGKADQPCLYHWQQGRFRSVSFKDLNAQAHCAAGYLMSQGLQPGQTVALLAEPSFSGIVMDIALQLLGSIGLHLPADLPAADVARLVRSHQSQFIFVGGHPNFLRLGQLEALKPDVKGIFLDTEDADGLSAEKLVTFDIMVMRGKAVWREELAALNARKEAVAPDDTYGLFAHNPANPTQFAPVRYRRLLEHLREVHERFEAQPASVVAAITPDRYLQHVHGSLAPLAFHQPLYLVPPEQFTGQVANAAHPGWLVTRPTHIEDLYERLPADFLHKPDAQALDKAQELLDIREAAEAEGKKPPFMKNLRYKTHNQSLYKQVRKKLGGQLTHLLSDHDTPARPSARFFEECGFEVETMALF